MKRNVEIKAKISHPLVLGAIVEAFSCSQIEFLQVDTYFNCPIGTLKLRSESGRKVELIYYRRDMDALPKLSRYWRYPVEDVTVISNTLLERFGLRGVVRKKRILSFVGQTRIHCDIVETLGMYLELEVVLSPSQTIQDGIDITHNMLRMINIGNGDLVRGSYIDLIENESHTGRSEQSPGTSIECGLNKFVDSVGFINDGSLTYSGVDDFVNCK